MGKNGAPGDFSAPRRGTVKRWRIRNMSKLKTAVIIGSARDSRFGPKPAQWIFDVARQREELDVELIDLKAFDLPLFNEKASNAWAPSEDPRAVARSATLTRRRRIG
jgi:hypothetical protein